MIIAVAFLAGLLLVAYGAHALVLRARRNARITMLYQMTNGCRAFNAYRQAGDAPGKTWDGVPIPQWVELPPIVRHGWAAFAGGLDAIDGYDRYRTTVRTDRLGRPIPGWQGINAATQARWQAAFDALPADSDEDEDDSDPGPLDEETTTPPSSACLAAVALLLACSAGCGLNWRSGDKLVSNLDALCRDPSQPLPAIAVGAGIAIADAAAASPDPEAAAASVADKVRVGTHAASALACYVERIVALFGADASGLKTKGDEPGSRVVLTARQLAAHPERWRAK